MQINRLEHLGSAPLFGISEAPRHLEAWNRPARRASPTVMPAGRERMCDGGREKNG
jgi:hypothetical protein